MNARLTYQPPNGDWRLSLAGHERHGQVLLAAVLGGDHGQHDDGRDHEHGAVRPHRRVASPPREWSLTIEKQF